MSLFLVMALSTGCVIVADSPEIEALEVGSAWVFAYSEEPATSMMALMSGQADIVDGCLVVDDSVVVWRPNQLADVEEVVALVEAGETVEVELGGGGISLDEGAVVDDFPEEIRDHCDLTAMWSAGSGEVTWEVP